MSKKKEMKKSVACVTVKCNNGEKPGKGPGSRWKHTAGNELLIKEVLDPLLEIVYLYKMSSCYNYVPGTTEDCDAGWDYFEKRFQDIHRAIDANLYISYETCAKAERIVMEIQRFVRSFSGAEGLSERFFQINPNLRFFRAAFELEGENREAYKMAAENGLLSYVPPRRDFVEKRLYFRMKHRIDRDSNFHHDKEDLFMQELSRAVRLLFLNDLTEFRV